MYEHQWRKKYLRKFNACADTFEFAKIINGISFFIKMCKFEVCVNACVKFQQFFCTIAPNCTKFGADLQPCALKKHYFSSNIRGFQAVGSSSSTSATLALIEEGSNILPIRGNLAVVGHLFLLCANGPEVQGDVRQKLTQSGRFKSCCTTRHFLGLLLGVVV